jgi:hemicentin
LGVDSRRTDGDFRKKFSSLLKQRCGMAADVTTVCCSAMERLLDQTILEPGIALSRGLQENVFMIFICLLTQVPLMIVGPPGSSKTLAVTTLIDNARGEFSKASVYKAAPVMTSFHYQCSRRSTSDHIKDVFERAIERQAKSTREGSKEVSFVFMDEAGLPEEGRESLKVSACTANVIHSNGV